MHTCKECSGEQQMAGRIGYVVGYLFSGDKERVALIKKSNCHPEQKWQENCLNGIGGKVDAGYFEHTQWVRPETSQEAMRREFREEAGVDIPEENWELFLTVHKNSRNTGNPITLYMFKYFSTERLQQVKTNSSEGEVLIVPVKELPYLPVIDPARIFLALERRRFRMIEETDDKLSVPTSHRYFKYD